MLIQDKALNHDIIRIKLKGPLREAALKQIEKVQFENKAGFNKLVNKHGKPATKHGVDDISWHQAHLTTPRKKFGEHGNI